MTKYIQFKPKEYHIDYEDCWIRFYCPKCHAVVLADAQNGHVKCVCGEQYKVSAILYHVIEEEKQ
jgi:hypothetical protein